MNPVVDRGKSVLVLNVKTNAGRAQALAITDKADVVIEGFRPGVMERLGLGPEVVCDRNARLVYGRMTGWGQTGPLATSAGHDINYIALTGALAAIGHADDLPMPPLNLVGDFGGGSLYLAFGILAALVERGRSGLGQVVDAAIVDGVASLLAMFAGLANSASLLSLERGRSMLSGAAPFYRCYACADGKQIAIGALEPKFYAELLTRIGAPPDLHHAQHDTSTWPAGCAMLADIFTGRTRDEWCAMLEGSDACFAPVLTLAESVEHPHMNARGVYVSRDGFVQARPAPRFSRTPGPIAAQRSAEALLNDWGVTTTKQA